MSARQARLVTVLGILAAFALILCVGKAGAMVDESKLPTVHERTAKFVAAVYLRRVYPDWDFRDSGRIDCNGGRVNRTHWRCRVRWIAGRHCWTGHVLVWGDYFDAKRGPVFLANVRAYACGR